MKLFLIMENLLGQSYVATNRWTPLRDYQGKIIVFEDQEQAVNYMWREANRRSAEFKTEHIPRGAMKVETIHIPGTD